MRLEEGRGQKQNLPGLGTPSPRDLRVQPLNAINQAT